MRIASYNRADNCLAADLERSLDLSVRSPLFPYVAGLIEGHFVRVSSILYEAAEVWSAATSRLLLNCPRCSLYALEQEMIHDQCHANIL